MKVNLAERKVSTLDLGVAVDSAPASLSVFAVIGIQGSLFWRL
jgi:fatty acid/phospholipid biosynthesis enzyme